MKTLSKIVYGTMAASALVLAGCDIDKTQDGKLPDVDVSYKEGNLPKYEVDVRKTENGRMPSADVDVKGGQLPGYEVETADVTIGTKNVKVKVPDVDVSMKEKGFKVPDVDIQMPDDDKPE